VDRPARTDSRHLRVGLLVVVSLLIGSASRPSLAAPTTGRNAPATELATASASDREAPMTVTVLPRSKSDDIRGTALVYLDGRIDADAPRRLSEALVGIDGKISAWLNSPGGNLFAGMELGRIIRAHGASTHIIDYRTLRPGQCYSACAMTFLGGVYRFNNNGARYGVHRASLLVGPNGETDLGHHLSSAIGHYIREMGVDPRLLDICMKAGRHEMYLLSQEEAKTLGVINNGRQAPEWSLVTSPAGTLLQGQQVTIDGTGIVSFSCDGSRTVFGAVYESAGANDPGAASAWRHLLTVGRFEGIPLKALSISTRDGVVRSAFILSPNLVRLAMSARHIGYQMRPSSNRPPSIDYRVDVDGRSVSTVKTFLGNCLRGRAK
jgi:hypothetical protein